MGDMQSAIKSKSDQLNADDLVGGSLTVEITKRDFNSEREQPLWLFYANDPTKPYKPSLTMRRLLTAIWGDESAMYVGKSLTLFRNEKTRWAGKEVGGIEISHMSGIEKTKSVTLKINRKEHRTYTVEPLKVTSEKKELPKTTVKDSGSSQKPAQDKTEAAKAKALDIIAILLGCDSVEELDAEVKKHKAVIDRLKEGYPDLATSIRSAYSEAKTRITTPHDPETGEVMPDMPSPPVEAYEDTIGGEPINEDEEQDLF